MTKTERELRDILKHVVNEIDQIPFMGGLYDWDAFSKRIGKLLTRLEALK